MNAAALIAKKRDGGALTDGEIRSFVERFVAGDVADYQMSAFLMAVFLRGMTAGETAALTRAMLESGEVLSFPEIAGRKVDKHSTGGVGDLVSLPLAPLVAAAGVTVPMISGRGLGHTGGTLDKLESIPGFRTTLDGDAMRRVIARAGFAMGGQTASIAPADRRMYALRDVTATVESIPLIVSSILSKKVAEGIDAVVFDVKCGRGAFMKTEEDARRLARELCRTGALLGKDAVAFVTDMDQPLGAAIGNAVEVASSLDCLRGKGPDDLMTLVTTLGAAMVCLGGRADSWEAATETLQARVADGEGLARFRAMTEAQGGDPRVVDEPSRLPAAPHRCEVRATGDGFVADVDPLAVAEGVLALGGGRRRAEDAIDPAVGVLLRRKRGDRVAAGDVLAEVLAARPGAGEAVAAELAARAFRTGDAEPERLPLVRRLVTADGDEAWEGPETWRRARSGATVRRQG